MSLQQLIKDRLAEEGMSFRRAADRAIVDGKPLVSYSTLAYISQGKHKGRCDDETLRGIALAINVPLARVRREQGKPEKEPPPFELPEEAKYLTTRQRAALLTIIHGMLSSPD